MRLLLARDASIAGMRDALMPWSATPRLRIKVKIFFCLFRIAQMMRFTLRQLEAFVAVMELRSVSLAARRLRLTPGAVSLAISELEAAMAVQLIVRRRGKGAEPTPAGVAALDRARATLAEAQSLGDLGLSLAGELTGPLRIGCLATLSPWFVPPIIGHFVAHHAGVDVQFVESATGVLTERLRAGELDAALMYANHLASGIVGREIASARLQVVLPPDHRLAHRETVPLSELDGEPAILLGIEPSLSHVEDLVRRAGHAPLVRWRSTNPETIRAMVARGLGYTIIMGRPFGDRSIEGLPLVYRRIADPIPRNAVVVATPKGTRPHARLVALLDFCERHFAGDDLLG
jgi:Transcriptional regulator